MLVTQSRKVRRDGNDLDEGDGSYGRVKQVDLLRDLSELPCREFRDWW